jgi:hypothetical protein
MWLPNLNILDLKLWRPYSIPHAVIPNRLVPLSARFISRLFDSLQSFLQHCKLQTDIQ